MLQGRAPLPNRFRVENQQLERVQGLIAESEVQIRAPPPEPDPELWVGRQPEMDP